ncbi:MAG: hypothetical protein INH41_09025 [Myxococcaceae bacterium]|jgi:hypothetical protein|nr:hypothetical protein [Myxococcaceae bacterium]MCA3012526.1 hypothetical protein [Myxococcaceae bacterium]
MLAIRGSQNLTQNDQLTYAPRRGDESNGAWLARHLPAADDGLLRLLLVGGAEPLHFRLRVAQAHARHDLSPSHWSHVALLSATSRGRRQLWECALDPEDGFGFPPEDNAFRFGALEAYDDPRRFPNVALLTTGARHEAVLSKPAIHAFRHQRAAVDVVALLHAWLGYAWGVGASANPLQQGLGVPSAAAADTLLASAGFDLTPGLSSRASCPEVIWQAAKWWQRPADAGAGAQLRGVFCLEHALGARLGPKGRRR